MKTVRLAVSGAMGKMGRTIISLALADKRFQVVCAIEKSDHPCAGREVNIEGGSFVLQTSAKGGVDVLIDFSSPQALTDRIEECTSNKIAMVVGTTGLSSDDISALRNASKKIPVLQSYNMSIGVNLLVQLVTKAAAALGEDWDVEIIETHHNQKKDAPSGTALMLKDAVLKGRNKNSEVVYGRKGESPRKKGEIGIHSIRGGDIVGEHSVQFISNFETLELAHRARSREIFARGALLAALFVAERKSGLFSMEDVVQDLIKKCT